MRGDGDGAQDGAPDAAIHERETTPATARRWARRVDGVNLVELDDPQLLGKLPPERKLLAMVLLLALKDHASVLDFEPGPFDSGQSEGFTDQVSLKLFYVVNGERIELVPPPPHYKDVITREVQRIAGLASRRKRIADILRRTADAIDGQPPMPRQGRIRLKCGEVVVNVQVVEYRTEYGPRLVLCFDPRPSASWEWARLMLKDLFALSRQSRAAEATPSHPRDDSETGEPTPSRPAG